METKIIYVDYGIANNFGEFIEVNKNLKKYPHLLHPILKHELSHTNKFFTLHDLKIDLVQNVNSWDMLKFMIKHPRSFSQLLPIYFDKKKGFIYDVNLILIYVFMAICITGTVGLISLL